MGLEKGKSLLKMNRSCFLALTLVLGACGASSQQRHGSLPQGAHLSEEQYGSARRAYHGESLGSDERARLRSQLFAHLFSETAAVLRRDDYEAMVEHFAAFTDLLLPEELTADGLPPQIEPLARALVEKGSAHGDEARVLSGLLALQLLEREPKAAAEYAELLGWGRDARATLSNPIEAYSQLIDVLDEHARLTPDRRILDALAELHVQRRDVLVHAFRERGLPRLPLQMIRTTPIEVAAVYLQWGQIAPAITRIEAMGGGDETTLRLQQLLQDARGTDPRAADALLELAEAYRRGRPLVSQGICRRGLREMSNDPRFAGCLARVAAELEQPVDATAWYAHAISLAPTERSIYDEALETLHDFIEAGLFDTDASEARSIARHAETILEARLARWPQLAPPVQPERLHLLIGTLEMNAGNPKGARKQLERSIAANDSADARSQLGLLEARVGHLSVAEEHLLKAVELLKNDPKAALLRRAETLERLGDVYREQGRVADAQNAYGNALKQWSAITQKDPELQASAHLRRGVLLDRVGEKQEALAAFRQAMLAAPWVRSTYASILSHLVTATPDAELAIEVFNRAQRQFTLESEWKVYFALWVKVVEGRAGAHADRDVAELLRSLSSTDDWAGSLARFGVGALDYEGLLRAAHGLGQETEAHFYEGARRLTRGDAAGARLLFQRVMGSHMVSFYEFQMAQELLGRGIPKH